MTARILKYRLATTIPEFAVPMPADAEILSVQIQRGDVCLWAIADPDGRESESIVFRWNVTGEDALPPPWKYVATVQFNDQYVFHLFRLPETRNTDRSDAPDGETGIST